MAYTNRRLSGYAPAGSRQAIAGLYAATGRRPRDGEVADVVPYINLANIVLSPLEIGGGTRLKIIEALACGQAVLSTRFGALGLELTGVGGLHCCDWPDF